MLDLKEIMSQVIKMQKSEKRQKVDLNEVSFHATICLKCIIFAVKS